MGNHGLPGGGRDEYRWGMRRSMAVWKIKSILEMRGMDRILVRVHVEGRRDRCCCWCFVYVFQIFQYRSIKELHSNGKDALRKLESGLKAISA